MGTDIIEVTGQTKARGSVHITVHTVHLNQSFVSVFVLFFSELQALPLKVYSS